MKSKFDQYFNGDLGMFHESRLKTLFEPWDFDKILNESSQWRLKARWLFVYVLANNCQFRTLHAHIGCTQDIYKRLAQHNCLIPGGPSATRKAAGHWKLIVYFIIPPYTNYSSKDIKIDCRKGRGWVSRCKKAIKTAIRKGLHWRVTKDIADSNSPYHAPQIIETIKTYGKMDNTEGVFLENVQSLPSDIPSHKKE